MLSAMSSPVNAAVPARRINPNSSIAITSMRAAFTVRLPHVGGHNATARKQRSMCGVRTCLRIAVVPPLPCATGFSVVTPAVTVLEHAPLGDPRDVTDRDDPDQAAAVDHQNALHGRCGQAA